MPDSMPQEGLQPELGRRLASGPVAVGLRRVWRRLDEREAEVDRRLDEFARWALERFRRRSSR
jgi:hypothetical protein